MRYSTVIAVRRISILKLELSAAHWEIARRARFLLAKFTPGLKKDAEARNKCLSRHCVRQLLSIRTRNVYMSR